MAAGDWRIIESVIAFKDPWISVRSDRCLSPEGKVIEPYHVLEYGGWVNVVALTREAEIVLVREYRHGAAVVLTGLPGGGMEATDAGPEAACRRELREETGYTGGEFYLLGRTYANPALQNNEVYSFLALGVEQTEQASLDPNEEIELVRTPFVEYARRVRSANEVRHAFTVASIHLATGYILSSDQPELAALREALRADLLGTTDDGV